MCNKAQFREFERQIYFDDVNLNTILQIIDVRVNSNKILWILYPLIDGSGKWLASRPIDAALLDIRYILTVIALKSAGIRIE